jgi:hypothetical protein
MQTNMAILKTPALLNYFINILFAELYVEISMVTQRYCGHEQ